MKRLLLTITLIAIAGAASPVDSLCDQAAYLFFNRHLSTGYLDSAYSLLSLGRETDPNHQRCLYLWSRIHVQKGDIASAKSDKFKLYERARAIAETLKTLNEYNMDGHMWWAVAHGRIGQTRGVMNSLFMVPTLKKAFNRVLEFDSTYTTAYDALGVLYYELPGIVGGNLGKSKKYLTMGLQVDPNYTLLRLDLAKVYVKQKRWQETRDQLNIMLATENPTCPADFELDDKPEALELLEKIKDK